ncbi:MAG: molybdopterin oxidoreductase family protein [Gemmatimonadetes bacterium]|nr:molybdopterin oxidoreductase family protein [Gemmatimonadota bacterium]
MPPATPERRVVRGACPHDCPDTCAMLVTVERETGGSWRAVDVRGDPDHPVTRGFLCAKVDRYLERTYHPDRLARPLRRVGAKGEGRFAPLSWDDALDEIAARLKRVVHESGPQAVLPYSYAGTMGLIQGSSMDRRFFHRLGASLLDRTICSTAGGVGMQMTVGQNVGTDTEAVGDAKLVVLWGTNTLTSNPHLWPLVRAAREQGAPVIAIDPLTTRTTAQCDRHFMIRPGTDAALALGMMHVIFAEGLADRDYLERHALGADALEARVREYPVERVAEITELPAGDIRWLAREYARAKPAFIRVNYGLQRHAGGGMAVRCIASLPAVAGHWRHPAGGVQLSTSAAHKFDKAALERFDLIPPGTRTINMSRLAEALAEPGAGVGGPPVRALVVYNSNPGAVAPDRARVRRGLAREDLFTVVLEHFVTDTALFADLVLPATTQLEHWDVHLAYGHYYVTLNRPSIAAVGDALPNSEIFRRLAARMGFDEPCFRDSDKQMIRQALASGHRHMEGITFERLLEHGWARLNLPSPWAPYAEGGFATPSGKCELYSERLASRGLDPVPTYTPPRESREENPSLAARYPLALISPPAHQFLNSTFVNVDSLRKKAGAPTLRIHPDDAAPRAIADGLTVRCYNDRGGFRARAVVTVEVKRGVVQAPSIWWGKFASDGMNANETTSLALTDMGGGATFYDNLVEVAPAD